MIELKTFVSEIKHVYIPKPIKRVKLTSSKDVSYYSRKLLTDDISIRESMIVLYLNRANNVICFQVNSIGGLNGTVMDINLVLKGAVDSFARSIILVHNHPSGNVNPSDADIKITNKIKECLIMHDKQILDHVIISGEDDTYYSFADEGTI